MASSEYTYDEQGEVWPYFILAILCFILIPLTIRYFYRLFSDDNPLVHNKAVPGSIVEDHTTLDLPNKSLMGSYHRKQTSDRILNKTLIVLIVGWSLVFYIGLNFTQAADVLTLFDPYEILGISSSSTEKQIKSHYRKLTLKFHPDKIAKDLSTEARDELEQTYIRLNKAYKALTDDVTRENYLKFGHPDGRQDVSHGIALPKFLVEGKFSPFMVIFYFILIGGLLPTIVGSWWNNVKSHTSKGLHVNTASLFTRTLADRNPAKIYTPYDILDLVCLSHEITHDFSHLKLNEIKELISKHLTRDFSHLQSNPNLEHTKLEIVSLLPKLIQGFIDIAVIFRHHDVLLAALDLQKAVLQAVKPVGKYQDLLQLPFVDANVVENQPIKKLGKLFTLSRDELSKTLGIQDSKKLDKAMEVAEKIATLRVIESEFRVPGEEVVTPMSKAHLTLKFLVKSPKLKSCPEIDESRLKDEETLEFLKDPFKINTEGPLLPYSYAPFFPNAVLNNWKGFLISQKDNKLVENSSIIDLSHADISNINLNQQQWIDGKEENVIISTLNIQLPTPTPANPGNTHYRVILKNNAYFGVDLDIPVTLEVQKPPAKPINKEKLMRKLKPSEDSDSDSDSDISDPEEDSLAGALAALRGQPVKKTDEQEKIEEIDEDEEEEEGDDESVFTDINTDTEDEQE